GIRVVPDLARELPPQRRRQFPHEQPAARPRYRVKRLMYRPGRHFLQIPGPTNVPDRVLRAIDAPTIDHRGPEFAALGKTVIAGMKKVMKNVTAVVIYPSPGTGAWEAALANTLSPGDHLLMAETGHFAALWKKLAERLGLAVDFIPGDWRHGAEPDAIEARLAADRGH